MDKLRISKNKRYLVNQNNKPFIWLADTDWTIAQRLKWDDVEYLMQKRKSQGFTVLQIVALDPEQDREMRNPVGEKALLNNSLDTPNEKYFQYLDWILDKAEEYGFYVLLLPVWGELVVGHNWMGEFSEKIITEQNAYEYGKWIGNRYKNRKNIIWCLGGDRQPIHLEVDYKKVWRNMAEGIAKGVLDKNLKYNKNSDAWKELLITYHPCHEAETGKCSTMSYWTDDDTWISFITIQSGHGVTPKNYELVKAEYCREKYMPVFDGEPAYEKMPTTWPAKPSDFHDECIIRKRAYWSLFAGSFGHTYGHASVWCMISDKEKDSLRKYSWFEALDHPGAWQIKILRDFLESRDLSQCIPAQEILIEQSKKSEDIIDEHIQACIETNGRFTCIYFPSGGEETINLSKFKKDNLQMWWFNPRDGKCYSQENIILENPISLPRVFNGKIVTPTCGYKQDWICIIENKDNDSTIPGKAQFYGEMPIPPEVRKVFPAW
ncbi:DUF4038 domain-containing protein [Clostridium felsineum]|uniref:apiosidase-like domain-containing protein n=1 Tax=Clostridium felsineum TaxID=36839 RepID=UPI00098BE54C|nr:DUF4038 domain-containing protein [Clostridium felsineum]URZ17284.1 hypothetical protein CLFE_033370 [Clostridium felsineum DSM 794]